jgi:transposase-like protein
LHGANPLDRRHKKVKRRADVVGILPNAERIVRLIGAAPLEADDEWRLQQRGSRAGQRTMAAMILRKSRQFASQMSASWPSISKRTRLQTCPTGEDNQ